MLLKGIKTTNTIGSPDYWAAQCQAQGEAPGGHYLYNNGTELVFVLHFMDGAPKVQGNDTVCSVPHHQRCASVTLKPGSIP